MADIQLSDQYIASTSEAAAELAAMSRADLIRLKHFARLRTVGLVGVDWEDLLHEAIDRVLAGTRKWPKSIPFVVFICGTMRSIASEYWRDTAVRREFSLSDSSGGRDHSEEAPPVDLVDDKPSPEREALARRTVRRIEQLFADDATALSILEGLAGGCTPDEIQLKSRMTSRQYATAQKRIRRVIARTFKERSDG
ncbi:sigma-70 family RNA polymerase sigma factor [Bradyrhizobium sp. 150]|uniref:sigma-70 family RNA polymerase sigma factor n=1 Tax=Bradyrhizobium sp. 150 TaxID=2782625 RepID=UPI001FF91A51|nr:sigma-70 family RNA polymerase sigma factor [Bradyrhizobium sp. 150]MCK1671701.1 sigma-70 family RNA polymerase sigma factor [Bradyrhizobium sp. 150]